jgi:hypothetical protein
VFLSRAYGLNILSFPWGIYAVLLAPLLAVVSAIVALLDVGAKGAFGSNPAAELRAMAAGFMWRHLIFMIGFIGPQVVMALEHERSVVFVAIPLLCLYPMIFVSDGTDKVIAERAEESNLSDFTKGIGERSDRSPKSIRRD